MSELLAPNTSKFLTVFESKDDKGDSGGVAKVRGTKEYSGRRKALKALEAIAVQQCRQYEISMKFSPQKLQEDNTNRQF